MSDNSDNSIDDLDKNSHYFENNNNKGRNHQKFREFDIYNNKKSIRTFLTLLLEKNPNFSLNYQSPEEIMKIYNCYLSGENLSFENDFDTNDTINSLQSQNMKRRCMKDSAKEENSKDDHFTLKEENQKLNIFTDIHNINQADARELLFSYFELVNLPFLTTQAFSLMVIDGSKDEDETEADLDNDDTKSNLNQNDTQINEILPNNLYSILLNKFLKNIGSLEVFVDHYSTILSPVNAKTYKTNKEFIESRILQFKSVTTILTCYPGLIARMSKIIKKFAPVLFSLLKQSDISTTIEVFRCIVSIFNNRSNIIKKKTRRKWLSKLVTFLSPDSPLLPLITNFFLNQKMIKFELPIIADRIIEKSIFNGNKKRNLNQSKKDGIDDYKGCSQLAPHDDCFDGCCNLEVLNTVESVLLKISQFRNRRPKKIKIPKDSELNNDDNLETAEPNQDTPNEDINILDHTAPDLQSSITFLINVAIEDTIFGKYATEVIRNVLVAFTSPNDKIAEKSDTNDDNDNDNDSDDDYFHPSGVLIWSVFLIRKSIIMFSMAERSDNFKLFDRRCRCIEHLCCRICQVNQNEQPVSDFVVSKIKKIAISALLAKKKNVSISEGEKTSIERLARKLGIDINKSSFAREDTDVYTTNFLNSTISEIIEDSELTQFVHFPFDEKIDALLMDV